MNLLLAAAFVVCTNCTGVGSVSVLCPSCQGRGLVAAPAKSKVNRQNMARGVFLPSQVPCKKCCRGLVTPTSKGSGKIMETCQVCKGQKKVKAAMDSDAKK